MIQTEGKVCEQKAYGRREHDLAVGEAQEPAGVWCKVRMEESRQGLRTLKAVLGILFNFKSNGKLLKGLSK